MAVDERPARSTERCSLHPGSQAVAACEGCGRPLCLWCAVPVRGLAYGNECLGLVLGEEPPAEPEPRRPWPPLHALLGFVVALASTSLPWTTFGEGSTAFGAWSISPRWSLLASVGSVAGAILALARVRRERSSPRLDVALIVVGAFVVAGSVLEWFRPPFPSRPSLVPWLAALAGAFALVSAVRTLADDRR